MLATAEGMSDSDGDESEGRPECQNIVEEGQLCDVCGQPHFAKKRALPRPTRGKRNRYRCLVSNLMRQVDADPAGFELKDSRLPPSIASNDFMKRKLEAKMAQYVAARFAELEAAGQSPSPGAAAEKAAMAERAVAATIGHSQLMRRSGGATPLLVSPGLPGSPGPAASQGAQLLVQPPALAANNPRSEAGLGCDGGDYSPSEGALQ